MQKSILTLLLCFSLYSISQAQTTIDASFFNQADALFKKYVSGKDIKYSELKNNAQLSDLIQKIETADLASADAATRQAFYINAYNLLVISAVADNYPLGSTQDIAGFFDAKKYLVAGKKHTLNDLEKKELLNNYKDPRFHFVLVCGAKGCPPIIAAAYRPETLEAQLEAQTAAALNDKSFTRVNKNISQVGLSRIFEWYASDFGGNKKAALDFVNSYRKNKIPQDYKISFYPYDWKLNEASAGQSSLNGAIPANAARYVVSSTRPKGTTETKLFNNLYTQKTGSNGDLTDRSTFLTSTVSFLYGVSDRFNAGFDLRFRGVANESLPSSPLNVFSGTDSSRYGITNVGPKIRIAPVPKWSNFSIQSALWIPTGNDLEGTADKPYIDWNKPTFVTQFFNDFSIGNNFSVFTELDFWAEDFGGDDGDLNRISTPAILIFSYFPNPKTTIYAIGGYSPFWQEEFDYFYQTGIGFKYQFTRDFEIELLISDFSNKFLADSGGQAATYNIGFRYNGN